MQWTTKPSLYHRDMESTQTNHIHERLAEGEKRREILGEHEADNSRQA